jgi:hypothetical protein
LADSTLLDPGDQLPPLGVAGDVLLKISDPSADVRDDVRSAISHHAPIKLNPFYVEERFESGAHLQCRLCRSAILQQDARSIQALDDMQERNEKTKMLIMAFSFVSAAHVDPDSLIYALTQAGACERRELGDDLSGEIAIEEAVTGQRNRMVGHPRLPKSGQLSNPGRG